MVVSAMWRCSAVLLCLLAVGARACPHRCHCDPRGVVCTRQGLTSVPHLHGNISTLDLRINKIQDLGSSTFSHHQQLRSLLLNDNHIQTLKSGVFRGLNDLVYLYLYRNRIRHIDGDVFAEMNRLEQLYLNSNELHTISADTFSGMLALERLYLNDNHLRGVPAGSFSGDGKLQKLRLDNNDLVCDCGILWLVRMLTQHRQMSVAASCFGPAGTRVPLVSMTDEDFNCREPHIVADPDDAAVTFGEDVAFTCVVSGDPPPVIVWMRDSSEIPLDHQRYQVFDNGTLMVHAADETDVGLFECMAKNPVGEATSKPARMMVQMKKEDAMVFILKPEEKLVRIGEQVVRFDCQATGNPRPHVTWYFDGERMLLSDRVKLYYNGTLSIEDVIALDAGLYTCQADNFNEKISASAMLILLTAPAFTAVPDMQTVSTGETVELICKARGSPEPAITWFKDGLSLEINDNILLSDNNQNLTIIEATDDDTGEYHCRALNSEGLAEISALLTVNELEIRRPLIAVKPENTEAFKETTVQLFCEVDTEFAAKIEWRKDGSRINPEGRILITPIGNLIINNLTLADTATYECSAYNEQGRDTASAALLVKDHILPGEEYVNIALIEAANDVDQAITNTIEQLFQNNTAPEMHDLFRISRYPNAPARDIARAAEIYERSLEKVKTFVKSGMKANSTEAFDYHTYLSPKHLDIIARLSGCTAHREEKVCNDMCFHRKYRTADGTCNNLAHPTWGSSLTGFRRILYPIYENGFSQPVGWNKDMKYNGYSLPSSRLISTQIISTDTISEDERITHMTMQWGQWLDHDLDHALPSVSSQTWDGIDCKKTCDYAAPCFPIDVPDADKRISNRRCIDFIRTSSVCGSGTTSVLFGKLQPREQINQLTSFLDASHVYGFEDSVAQDLRDLTNQDGLLRVGAKFPGRKPLLPTSGLNGMDCRRNLSESTRNCFVAGDIRANEQVGLAAMHTIWMREHNRLATELKKVNPFWTGDKLYHEARKIVAAEMQHITYAHWLPLIIGPEGYKEMGSYRGYNSSVNPSVSNVFATAALRFGHSLINPVLRRLDENYETIPQGDLKLRHAFFSPWRLVDEGGVDPLLRGMIVTPAKLKKPTENLNTELTERLFEATHAVALDLAAINIQRGRDHAIPPYGAWRSYCGLPVAAHEDELGDIANAAVRRRLLELYETPLNIDVWVGGILEEQVDGGKVGPLFRCLLIEQFQRLRDGDRFWYENPTTFKPEQLQQIRQTSLARVLCDNGDNIDTVNEDVFILPELQDGLVACEDVPAVDLRHWADCETCGDDAGDRARHQEEAIFKAMGESTKELKVAIEIMQKRIEDLEESCIK